MYGLTATFTNFTIQDIYTYIFLIALLYYMLPINGVKLLTFGSMSCSVAKSPFKFIQDHSNNPRTETDSSLAIEKNIDKSENWKHNREIYKDYTLINIQNAYE